MDGLVFGATKRASDFQISTRGFQLILGPKFVRCNQPCHKAMLGNIHPVPNPNVPLHFRLWTFKPFMDIFDGIIGVGPYASVECREELISSLAQHFPWPRNGGRGLVNAPRADMKDDKLK